MRFRRYILFMLVIVPFVVIVIQSKSENAYEAPILICTWNGSSSNDISVASNWTLTSGTSCGGSSTSSGSATLAGAELIFPATVPAGGSTVTLDMSESVDDIVFQNSYNIEGTATLTLDPVSNSLVDIDVTYGGSSTIFTPVFLGAS